MGVERICLNTIETIVIIEMIVMNSIIDEQLELESVLDKIGLETVGSKIINNELYLTIKIKKREK